MNARAQVVKADTLSVVTVQEFLAALLQPAPAGSRAWCTQFESHSDPHWTGRPCTPDSAPKVNGENAYYSVSAFTHTAEQRVIDKAEGACVVLCDDVGQKASAEAVVAMLGEPSFKIRTSAVSQQWGYLLKRLATDAEMKPIHERLVELKLCDRSGNNLVRYGRLPAGINNKPEHPESFAVHCVEWHPERRFAVEEIAERLASGGKPAPTSPPTTTEDEGNEFEQLTALIESGEAYHEPLTKLAAKYVARGFAPADVVYMLRGRMVSPEDRSPRWRERFEDIERTVLTAVEKFAPADRLREFNDKYAVINWKGRTVIVTQPTDPTTGRRVVQLSTVTDLRVWLQNVPPVGKKPAAIWWLEHPGRRQFEGVVFAPQATVPGYLNLWRGWGYTPARGDCSAWLGMVKDVICSGDEGLFRYVIGWSADAIQHPTERPGVTLVLLGKQGTGKGTFARELGALFGEHFLHIRHSRHLVGNFNAHLANVLLVFADEAVYPGDKQSEGALKALITEPTLPIEYKGKDVVSVANHIRVVMASNQAWVVPAAMDDRRFAVIEVSEARAQDTDYFARINAQMNNGGRAALLDYLLNFDLTGIDLRKIPETRARLEQQLQSMDPFYAFWFERLADEDGWHAEQKTDEVMEAYRAYAGRYPMHETAFGTRAHKLFPNLRKVRLRESGNPTGRQRYYVLPPLQEAREAFERAVSRKLDWSQFQRKDEDREEPF